MGANNRLKEKRDHSGRSKAAGSTGDFNGSAVRSSAGSCRTDGVRNHGESPRCIITKEAMRIL